MNEEILKNLSNLQGLTDFIYQPVYSKEYIKGISIEELAYFFPSEANTEELLDPTIFGYSFLWPWPFDKIGGFFTQAYKALEEMWDKIKQWWSRLPIWWLIDTLEKLRDFWYTLRDRLAYFVWQPLDFLSGVINTIVSQVRTFGQNVIVNISDFVENIWNRLYNYISPRFDSLWTTISNRFSDLWSMIIQTIESTVHQITDPIGQTFSWLWDRMREYFDIVIHSFEIGLFYPWKVALERLRLTLETAWIAMSEPWRMIGLMLTDPAAYLIKLNEEIGRYVNEDWFLTATGIFQEMGGWLENWFDFITDGLYREFDKIRLSAPSQDLKPKEYFKVLMRTGAKVLGGMTGLSVLVSALSRAQLGQISAVLYDMTGYKYITGAIIGGLTTAAFVQPLKYFYNEKFRPYLPEWKVVLDLFNRNIIRRAELMWFAKWYGFREEWVWFFERYVATPITLIRQPDMIVWDTSEKGEVLEEMMFSGLEKEGCLRYLPAAWMKGKTMWLTRMVTEMMYVIRRGFALVPEMVKDVAALVAGYEDVTTPAKRLPYSVTWTIKKMPTTSEILDMISKWSTRRLTGDGLITGIKAEFTEDLITEDEAKERLLEVIKIPELAEGELAPIKARKLSEKGKERAKDLRAELKTVFSRCYKEGFITHKRLEDEIDKADRMVYQKDLILARSEWERFYDDTYDVVKIYKDSLKDGIITETEFRRDLIDMGLRPAKVEYYIRADFAKKTGRLLKIEEVEAERIKREEERRLLAIIKRKVDILRRKLRTDIITEVEFISESEGLGLTEEDISVSLEEERVKRAEKLITKAEREAEKERLRVMAMEIKVAREEFRRTLITKDVLKSRLREAGEIEEMITLIIKAEEVREKISMAEITRREVEKILTATKRMELEGFISNFLEDIITETEFRAALRGLAISERNIGLIVEGELARKYLLE